MANLKVIENELVPVYETDRGVKVVNGRDLHRALESKQDFSTWVKKRLSECDAMENEDFDRLHKKMEANNATMIDYIIKLDTAKEMAMLERNEKGKQVRKYFIQVEEKYKQAAININQLSPELQMFNQIFQQVAKTELEQKRLAERADQQEKNMKTIIDTFTVDEMKRMIRFYDGTDFLSVRNKTIIMLLFDTGMRCNEMILMEPEDIKPDYILVKHGKGSKERVVPKSPALSKQLMKYRTLRDAYLKEYPSRHKNLFLSKNGKPLTDEAVARMLKYAAKEVGVSPSVRVSPHTCRHTFAQMQLKNGLDLYSVSRLMGHVNIMITQRYLLGIKDKDIVDRGTQTSPLMNL